MRGRARAHGVRKYAELDLLLANFYCLIMLIAIEFEYKGIGDSNGKFRFYQ